jgi:hypothetical protein
MLEREQQEIVRILSLKEATEISLFCSFSGFFFGNGDILPY